MKFMKKSLIAGIVVATFLIAGVAVAAEQLGKQNKPDSQNQNPSYGYQSGHRGYGYYKNH